MDEKEIKDFEFMNKGVIGVITEKLIEQLEEYRKSGKISAIPDEFLKNKLDPILKEYSTAPFTEYIRDAVIRKVKKDLRENTDEIKTKMLYKEIGLDFNKIKKGGAEADELDNLPDKEIPREAICDPSKISNIKPKKREPLNDSLELFKPPLK